LVKSKRKGKVVIASKARMIVERVITMQEAIKKRSLESCAKSVFQEM
jgi:hypothetical protein